MNFCAANQWWDTLLKIGGGGGGEKNAFKTITLENIRRYGDLAADICRALPNPTECFCSNSQSDAWKHWHVEEIYALLGFYAA
jgi:hypothetical protein